MDTDESCPRCHATSWAWVDDASLISECTRCGFQVENEPPDLTGITFLGPIR